MEASRAITHLAAGEWIPCPRINDRRVSTTLVTAARGIRKTPRFNKKKFIVTIDQFLSQ